MKFGVFHLLWAMPLSDIPALAARARAAAGGCAGDCDQSSEPLPVDAAGRFASARRLRASQVRS